MNKKYLLFILGFLNTAVNAQQQQYSMRDAVLGIRGHLAPANLNQLAWIPGSDDYTQVLTAAGQEVVLRMKVPKMDADTLLHLKDINRQLFGKDSLKKIPKIQWLDQGTGYFVWANTVYTLRQDKQSWQCQTWATLPGNADNIKVEPGQKQIAYTVDNNLYLKDANGNTHDITNEKDKNILCGQAVHRNEFGINEGIFFSPGGNAIAFYRMDQRMVNNYPVINWNDVPAINTDIKYPMAGGTSHEVTLGVYSPATRKTVYLNTAGPKDHYLTSVTWSPDEKSVYIALLNREQNHMWLNQYDAKTGALLRTLFEEQDAKYVEPQHPLVFLPGKNDEFIWRSQRDGFMHLYRYNTEGKLLNQVTQGQWLVNDIAGINKEKKQLIITASKESPLEKHIYAVQWENGSIKRIDQAPGTHTPWVNAAGSYLIDHYQDKNMPRNIDLLAVNKPWQKNLLSATNPLSGYNQPKIETVTLLADDGTSLYGKLIYPIGFDSAKKYPVIVYLYNGPHVQLVTNSFPPSGNLWYDYLAQNGYVVFTMDGRGSSNRGLKFEQATFRQLGNIEMQDQLKGVAYLKSLPFVNPEKMGVHGWSFGGFMTTSLMTRHPDVFKVGVAGGPVIDWSMYEVMYTERYMDTPKENPAGYAENNLLTKAKNLKGKLLMIHGAQDDVVVWQHSVKFVKACVDDNIQLDYFVYPGHPHNVTGKDRVHLMQKVTDYFDLYLK